MVTVGKKCLFTAAVEEEPEFPTRLVTGQGRRSVALRRPCG
jgi:hypothetical protein